MKVLIIYFFIVINSYSQVIYSSSDSLICNSTFELSFAKDLADQKINEIIIAVGKSFLETPYVAQTLEKGKYESLVVNLGGFDCYTFLESVFAISRCIKLGKSDFASYLKEIELIRYRNGELGNYTSRLHYFSDWIYDNSKRGIVKDISEILGGVEYKNKVFFMSKNFSLYKRLKNNSKFVGILKKEEQEISSRKYFYIPKNKILEKFNFLHSGDLIGITTNIKGLDVAHTAIVIKIDGVPHLLHASTVSKKVEISKLSLVEYLKRNSKHTGIMIVIPLEPK